ncbi:hypothetical protein ACRQU7_04345 [Caproiciproducens sp. R1]|uniref:hypothetical protein n=1 Tax=Caproiciproducens sp. R1 TaxID=3435000 RepID=UPI00403441E4
MEMQEAFWKSCRKYRFTIEQTKYPIELNFDEIQKKAEENRVSYLYMGDSGTKDKTMMRFPLGIYKIMEESLDKEDERLNFFNCWEANKCIRVQNGRIYTCSRIPHIDLFNRCFHTDLKVTDNDFIDIYKAKDKNEIYEQLARPTAFCRYCKVDSTSYGHPWRTSECNIHEWADMEL